MRSETLMYAILFLYINSLCCNAFALTLPNQHGMLG